MDSQKVRQPAGTLFVPTGGRGESVRIHFGWRGKRNPPPSSKKEQSDFQISRLRLFEMINELFADTVVICNHKKLPNNSFIIV